ncbi:MAG TPA: amino acid adenylation domain-containing protein [Chloroflexia bacterium]|nr:amino acid adenylation domain-containing protein [Chloroflexia bacterium]
MRTQDRLATTSSASSTFLHNLGKPATGEGSETHSYDHLSLAQRRIWALDQLVPGSPQHNSYIALHLAGPLDPQRLERCLKKVGERHDILRTAFPLIDGQPVQIVADLPFTLPLPLSDLSGLPEAEKGDAVKRLAREEAQYPFDLAQGRLIRAALLRLGNDEHLLLLTAHGIVCDDLSIRVLCEELAALYAASSTEEHSPLPQPPMQYVDYAARQEEWLKGEEAQAQIAYWKGQLGGNPPVLELPADRPRPPVQTHYGARQPLLLPSELVEAVKRLSQQEGVSLFLTMLSAFETLLYRYTGQSDIVLGTETAGRTSPEGAGSIGPLANMLALRTSLEGDPSFRELLKRVGQVVADAHANGDVPFEKLVEELQPERDLSRAPFFGLTFAFQDAPPQLEFPGLIGSILDLDPGIAKYDLSLSIVDTEGDLSGWAEYNSDLFDASTIRRMLGHFQMLLGSIVSDPGLVISKLPMLTDAERQQLLVGWNSTGTGYPQSACIHELFERQVEKTPDAPAISFKGKRLTYRQLNSKANKLAHHLRALGVGPEKPVGVCMERSLNLVAAMMGVLKAGGAYVPLDPAYPHDRLSFMLADSQAPVLLTQRGLYAELATLGEHGAKVVYLDDGWEEAIAGEEGNPAPISNSDNLAYILYTSGSTGRPKGVSIEHRSGIALIEWAKETYTEEELSRVLASTSISFDLSVFELFVTLSGGGMVVLVENALHLPTLGPEEQVTLVNTVPSAIAELLRTGGVPTSVRVVNLAGEPLQQTLVQQLYAQVPTCRVFNLYGPTEDTTYSTFALMEKGSTTLPTIGRPIANSQVYLLDRHGEPVPVGVPGELYMGGAGLARGYLNRPDLTAERFVPNPFSDFGFWILDFGVDPDNPKSKIQNPKSGGRLYRTGDLASYLPDGNIRFHGRLDHQVKLRGFRIELGEIEAVLRQYPALQDVVLMVREDVAGDKRLVAYVVPSPDSSLVSSQLRDYLRERLPEYMVPSAFVVLEKLPLTPNGKVDRRSLPAPELDRMEGGAEYAAPRSPVEEALAGIWASVLGIERVGIHDNFFDLGGHSLLATQVISRVREVLHAELPLRRFFETPTVAGLGESIEAALKGGSVAPAPSLHRLPRRENLPLSFAQQRLWFLDQWQPASAAYNIPVVMRLDGSLQEEALRKSINAIVERHEALRTTFSVAGDRPVQVIAPALDVPLPVVDLGSVPDEKREAEAQRLVKEEARRPFDLARGPLLRARLLRLDEERHQLVLVMHHIISDGWSMGVLAQELAELYRAFAAGEAPSLRDLPVQYADYTIWQREWLQGEALQGQLDYWKGQLAGAPAALEMPTDRPRPAMLTYRGAKQPYRLTGDLAQELKGMVRREGVTMYMALLSAFTALLHRYTGQTDIVVGSPIANRTRPEIEGLIGFFVNMLALRTDLSGDPTFRELLGRVREASLGAYGHQDLPFDRLVEEMQHERNLAYHPIFQVAFVLQNAPTVALQLPGLSIANLEVDKVDMGTARFDLMFIIEEREEGLSVEVEYSTDLFDASTITRMLEHYRVLLEGVVAQPDQRVSELPLLTDEERQQLLVEWNSTHTDYPRDECIHPLFERQAQQTPDAVALIFGEKRLTYQELDQRANRLARHLRDMGIGRETLVGVCMERSIEMVVALLGVLKAGGAYVPLDPSYPEERLRFMMEDTQISVLLTQAVLAEKLPAHVARVVRLDTDWSDIARQSSEPLESETTAENLAYVMYTSGSTGQPKGIGVPHRGVVRLVKNTNYADLSDDQVLLQFAPISFDASTLEIWGSLLNGARLVIYPTTDVPLLEELAQVIEEYGVTTLWLTAGLFHHMVEGGHLRGLTSLRQLLAGGDVLSAPHVRKAIQQLGSGCTLINGYGPTENTTFTCCYPMTQSAQVGDSVSIGRPIANTQVYLLDRHLQPVPVGVAGELYIGGDGLARGYLNRPNLTAERFVPNPFLSAEFGVRSAEWDEEAKEGSKQKAEGSNYNPHSAGSWAMPNSGTPHLEGRLYRTGDLARYLPDGRIEFLGRIDQQVKVRGFRIELGEIEAVLAQHPSVQDVVVTARERDDAPGDKRLVAYVVGDSGQGQPSTPSELRQYLKERLPEYMVPSAFVQMEKLPLTANGKVDRRALPAPELGRAEGDAEYVAPRNPVEETVAAIWVSVLGIERVGVHDSFFEVGGHSLAATQVVSRVREALRVELPLRRLFETPTIEGLAEAITEIQSDVSAEIPAISRASAEEWGEFPDIEGLSDEEVDALLREMMADR